MILPGLVPAGVPVGFRVTWDRIVPGLEQIPADMIPLTDSALDLGSSAKRWAFAYVDTLVITGPAYVGDTANANNAAGLTLNQLAADDEILSLKSSDVAHGLTSIAETDTYAFLRKAASAEGGATFRAVAEDAAVSPVMELVSYGGTATTTKSAAGRSLVEIRVYEHDGLNALANITADGNVFGVRAYVGAADTTLLLLDEDGDLWLGGALTAVGAIAGASLNLGGSTVLDIITGTAAWDPGNLLPGVSATTTITVTGAAVGDGVFVNNPFLADDTDMVLTGYVSGADTVTVSLVNSGLAAVDAAERTVRATVFKF